MDEVGCGSGAQEQSIREKVAASLEHGQLPGHIFDSSNRLAWVAPQLMKLLGAQTGAELGIGEQVAVALRRPLWEAVYPPKSAARLEEELATAGARAGSPPTWVFSLVVDLNGRERTVAAVGMILRDSNGCDHGTAVVFAPLLPARVVSLVSEGDEAMLSRMADLVRPAQRPAGLLFADIAASTVLARDLPAAVFFDLICRFTTAFDRAVADHGGIVGRHAGDGASAFFLPESIGSDSDAAEATLRTARHLLSMVREIAVQMPDHGSDVGVDGVQLKLGIHWGAEVYIGQIVSGGRLEVTAVGAEVNACARLEHVATGGQILVTKDLMERLTVRASLRLGVDQAKASYVPLAHLVESDSKAMRDAGSLSVTAVVG